MNTNQTPAASASRHTGWTEYDDWTFRRCVEHRRDYLNSTEVRDANGEIVCNTHVQHLDEMEQKAKACVNALAGMEPGAVAGLVAAVEKYLQVNSVGNRAVLRSALAALKGGAK